MRKVIGAVLVGVAVFCGTAWSEDFKQDRSTPEVAVCSQEVAQADLPNAPLFKAVCTNTCNAMQGGSCSRNGAHYFCTQSNCTTWGCTCMDGIIECGLL